jgi:hypothetical protein
MHGVYEDAAHRLCDHDLSMGANRQGVMSTERGRNTASAFPSVDMCWVGMAGIPLFQRMA